MFGFNDSWETTYCKNVEKKQNIAVLLSTNLEHINVRINFQLKGKPLNPIQKLYAFQIGYIFSEIHKINELKNLNSDEELGLILTTIVYWNLKKGYIHTEREATELVDKYQAPLVNDIYNIDRKAGYSYSQSQDNDSILIDYLTNHPESQPESIPPSNLNPEPIKDEASFKSGVELGIYLFKSVMMKGGEVKLTDIIKIVSHESLSRKGSFIEGFIHQMNIYSDSNEVIGLETKNNQGLVFKHREYLN